MFVALKLNPGNVLCGVVGIFSSPEAFQTSMDVVQKFDSKSVGVSTAECLLQGCSSIVLFESPVDDFPGLLLDCQPVLALPVAAPVVDVTQTPPVGVTEPPPPNGPSVPEGEDGA